jgi:hypothetical protein
MNVLSCNRCGDDAAYIWRSPQGYDEHLCSECARYNGAFERGVADGAFEALGFAVSLARMAGVTDDQLRDGFEVILTNRTPSIASYPSGGSNNVLGSDSRANRPWQWAGEWAQLLSVGGA